MKYDYLKMYKAYDALLERAGQQTGMIGPGLNLENLNLAMVQKARLLSMLKSKLADLKETLFLHPGLSLEEVLDLNFVSKDKLISMLKELYASASAEDKELIAKVLAALNGQLEKTEPTAKEQEPVAAQSITRPFKEAEVPEQLQKYYDYRLFAFNKLKDESYFPTMQPKPIRSGIGKLSKAELQELYRPENFYQLDRSQVMELLQATVNDYLTSQGATPCAVVARNLPLSKQRTVFGEYDPNQGCIEINSNILDKFENAKAANNSYYIYNLLTTAIHEARHRCQFSGIDNDPTTRYQKAMAQSLREPQSNMSFAEYLGSLDEIDARNASYEYIKEMAAAQDNDGLKAFYNSMVDSEAANCKTSIDPEFKSYFGSVYGAERFACTANARASQSTYYKVLLGNYRPSSYAQMGDD